MKIATVDGFKFYPMFTHEDLIEFLDWQKRCVADDISMLIKSGIPSDRWDHMQPTCIKTIYKLALIRIKLGKTAPLFALDVAFKEYTESLLRAFDSHLPTLCINMNGGYNYAYEFSDVKDFIPSANKALVLRGVYDPILIIENDAELDEWTSTNLKPNFSYLTSLRRFDSTQLERAFSDFHIHTNYAYQKTGRSSYLFVYTTAMDGNQMLEYVQSAKKGHFQKIIWVLATEEFMNNALKAQELAQSLGIEAAIYLADEFMKNEKLRETLNI